MSRHKVVICGVDTAKLPVLKNEAMRKLSVSMQKGNSAARQELINWNLRLALSVIQSFNNRVENGDELFQVACIGPVRSNDNFDLIPNVRVSMYDVPMIIGEIRRYL